MTTDQGVRRNPWAVLVVLCSGLFMTLLDTTIVNIAIPDMVDGLDAALDEVLWFVNAYMIVFAALQLVAGRLGDRYGPQRMFAFGLLLFTLASAACGFAASPAQMIVLRVVQGLGAAVMMPQTLTLVTAVFPAERRGVAFGIWSAVAGLATVAGPTLGGALVSSFGWRWIFFINVPIGVAALVATFVLVPDTRPGRKPRLDAPGVLLSTGGLFLIAFALIEGQRYDWGTIWSFVSIPLLGTLGVLLLMLFVVLQRHRQESQPLLPFRLFRVGTFTVSSVLGAALMFGSVGVLLPLTVYVQSTLGLSAVAAGITLAPAALVSLFVAPVAGNLVAKVGGRGLIFPGLLAFAAGIAWVAMAADPGASRWELLPGLAVLGVGMGLAFGPTSTLAVQDVPPQLLGAASGLLTTIRQSGSVLGAAAVGAVLQHRLSSELVERSAEKSGELPAPLQSGFRDGFSSLAEQDLQTGGDTGESLSGLLGDVPARFRETTGRLATEVFDSSLSTAVRDALLLAAAVVALAALLALRLPGRRKAAAPDGKEAEQSPQVEEPAEN